MRRTDSLVWVHLLVWIIIDIFRRHDLGGGAKAGWLILVLVLPFIGVVVRGGERLAAAPPDDAAGRDRQVSSCRRRTSRTWTPKVSSLARSPCSAA